MYQSDLLAAEQARLYRRGKGTFCIERSKPTLKSTNKVFCVDTKAQQAQRLSNKAQ
jgi:hypothetical protein